MRTESNYARDVEFASRLLQAITLINTKPTQLSAKALANSWQHAFAQRSVTVHVTR
jgi:hypothetical protein